MSKKHFYIVGTHDESDGTWIVTRCGQAIFAVDFINNMGKDTNEDLIYFIFESDASNNEEALEKFNLMWFDLRLRAEYVKQESKYYQEQPPTIGTNNDEEIMDNKKMAMGLMLIASGYAACAQALDENVNVTLEGAVESVVKDDTKAVKETKAKAGKKAKAEETVKEKAAEEVKAEAVASDDDFSDFDFDDAPADEKVYTVEDVRGACIKHAKANTKEKTYAILKEFGAKSPNDVKKEDFSAVMKKLEV